MPPEKHALLGASSAHRWLACPGSARLTEHMPDAGSSYAAAGSLAHEMAEVKARAQILGELTNRQAALRLNKLRQSPDYDPGMEHATDEYVYHLNVRACAREEKPWIALETRVDYTTIVPEGFGTADCIMCGCGVLDVIDYKNGSGVNVEAENNPQMMLYALGALEYVRPLYGDTLQTVHMSIVQPHAGGVKEWELPVEDLTAWGETVAAPAARKAFDGVEEFHAGEWCKFCKARATCMERAHGMFEVEPMLGATPANDTNHAPGKLLLSDDEIGDLLTRAKDVAAWLKDLETYALTCCINGGSIEGWKAVEGRSSRDWNNIEDAFRQMQERGIDEALLYERKPVSVAGLEKALGKKAFFEAADGLWSKSPGKPTLVPASDKRPPYEPARAVFEVLE